jgi:uncharacterized damage-inducible protein DinB
MEDAMAIKDMILPEFDQEMAATRRTLERVSNDKLGWKPHEKSYDMGHLAGHLANLPSWTVFTLEADSLDLAPPGEAPYVSPQFASVADILSAFDVNVAAARSAISGASDQHLMEKWTLLKGGNALMTLPRIAVLRSFVMNHVIHHRAQLGVYLRLNDIPVPAVYGPTADEASF